MESSTSRCATAEPLAPWFGGKKYLAKRLIARINAIPHRCYAEPFVGMGGVLLRKPRSHTEVINDLNGDIVNLYRVLREHPQALRQQFDWQLSSRQEFARLTQVPAQTLTDIQRAARFAYLQRLAFGGRPAHLATPGQMGTSPWRAARFVSARMQRLIRAAHQRLQGVEIECLDWHTFIRRYDRPFTLFYLDPPYWGHENDYGKGLFCQNDFARMAEQLQAIQGRFLMSINDHPQIRKLFDAFRIQTINTRYSVNASSTRRVDELLISHT